MELSEIADRILQLAGEQGASRYSLSGGSCSKTNKGGSILHILSNLREGKGMCISTLEKLAARLNKYPVCVYDDRGEIILKPVEFGTSEYLSASLDYMIRARGKFQYFLAKKVGRDPSAVSRMRNYASDGSLKTISCLLIATGATLEYLTDIDPSNPENLKEVLVGNA